jgi:hypothetical protein
MTRAGPSRESAARFATAIVLTKREAFEMCEAIAESERVLLRSGHAPEAARLAAIFELVESRLVSDGPGDSRSVDR